MDPNKLFKDLSWNDLTIDGDELKAIQGVDSKTIEHKDL